MPTDRVRADTPRGSRWGAAHRTRRASVSHHPRRAAPWTFHLGYGALCLDFANTVSWRGSGAPVDHLPDYEELIRFAQQSKLLSEDEARGLRRAAGRNPGAATRALRKAKSLREALYRIFTGLAGGRSPAATDLEVLNGSLPDALTRLRVAAGDGGVSWAWAGDRDALDRLVWPVARDAAVFLTSTDLSRLRTCANPDAPPANSAFSASPSLHKLGPELALCRTHWKAL